MTRARRLIPRTPLGATRIHCGPCSVRVAHAGVRPWCYVRGASNGWHGRSPSLAAPPTDRCMRRYGGRGRLGQWLIRPSSCGREHAIIYTLYALAVLLVMAVFAIKVTRPGYSKVPTALFTVWAIILVVTGVSLHLVSANTIPWVRMDLDRNSVTPDRSFESPSRTTPSACPPKGWPSTAARQCLFDVTSEDLTYGFGLFRADDSMVFQMQVVPGHPNDLLWTFEKQRHLQHPLHRVLRPEGRPDGRARRRRGHRLRHRRRGSPGRHTMSTFTDTLMTATRAPSSRDADADAEADPPLRRRRPGLLRLRGHRGHDHADLRGRRRSR